MLIYVAGLIVYVFALFLLVMAILCFIRPSRIKHFFDLFAVTKQAHFFEQLIRLLVGLGLIGFADMMMYSWIFQVFGWLIITTSLLLMALPWQWHQKFAQRVIPIVNNHLKVYGLLSLFFALIMIYSAIRFWVP